MLVILVIWFALMMKYLVHTLFEAKDGNAHLQCNEIIISSLSRISITKQSWKLKLQQKLRLVIKVF